MKKKGMVLTTAKVKVPGGSVIRVFNAADYDVPEWNSLNVEGMAVSSLDIVSGNADVFSASGAEYKLISGDQAIAAPEFGETEFYYLIPSSLTNEKQMAMSSGPLTSK